MEPHAERPWTESEKISLLAEILKEAGVPTGILLTIINDAGVEPRWTEIPLPQGRSLRSCQNAFHALRSNPPPPIPMRLHPMQSGQGLHIDHSTPNPLKRPHPAAKDATTPSGRALQPRPPTFSSINGQKSSPFQPSSPMDDPNQPPKKKRGRPSKAEVELRAAAAAAKGEVYPPPKPTKLSASSQLPTKMYSSDEAGPAAAAAAAESASLTGSEGGVSGPGESGSAVKKRRGRPTKEEAQAKRLLLEAAAVAASGEVPAEELHARLAPSAESESVAETLAEPMANVERSATIRQSSAELAK